MPPAKDVDTDIADTMEVTVKTMQGEVFRGTIAFCEGTSVVLEAGAVRQLENGREITYPYPVWLMKITEHEAPGRPQLQQMPKRL
jgi:hypothetical protein